MASWTHRQLLRLHATAKQALVIYVAAGVAVPIYLLGQFALEEQKLSTPSNWSTRSRLNLHGARQWALREQWDKALPALQDVLNAECSHHDIESLREQVSIYSTMAAAKLQLGRANESLELISAAADAAELLCSMDLDTHTNEIIAKYLGVAARYYELQQQFRNSARIFYAAYVLSLDKLLHPDLEVDRLVRSVSSDSEVIAQERAATSKNIIRNLRSLLSKDSFSNMADGSVNGIKSQILSLGFPGILVSNSDSFEVDKIPMIPPVSPGKHTKYPADLFHSAFGLARSLHQYHLKDSTHSPFTMLFSSTDPSPRVVDDSNSSINNANESQVSSTIQTDSSRFNVKNREKSWWSWFAWILNSRKQEISSQMNAELQASVMIYDSISAAYDAFRESVSPCSLAAARISQAALFYDEPAAAMRVWNKEQSNSENISMTVTASNSPGLSRAGSSPLSAFELSQHFAIEGSDAAFSLTQQGDRWINTKLVGDIRRARESKFCGRCAAQALLFAAELRCNSSKLNEKESLIREALKIANRYDLTVIRDHCIRKLNKVYEEQERKQ